MSKIAMALYGWGALIVSVGGIAAMLIVPPPSMRVDRDGVPHFTPHVENPETGKAVSVNEGEVNQEIAFCELEICRHDEGLPCSKLVRIEVRKLEVN